MLIKNNFPKESGVDLEVNKNGSETPTPVPPQDESDIPMTESDSLVINLSPQGRVKYKDYYIMVRSSTLCSVKITDQGSGAGGKISEKNQLTINMPPENIGAGDEKKDISIGPEPPGEPENA